MLKKTVLTTVVTGLLTYSAFVHAGSSTHDHARRWMSGKRVPHPAQAAKEFEHEFHWKRHRYLADAAGRYYWQSHTIYLYAPNKRATESWIISNTTPAPLAIHSTTADFTLEPNTTTTIPRNGKTKFNFYSYH